MRYSGLASRVPAVLPLLRALSAGGDQSDRLSRLQDYLDGLEAVATQLTAEPRRPARADVVRLLLASDIHDNVFGARAAARLAAGGGEPVDGVLLAGDLTDTGTAEEARLFLRVFGPRRSPVLLVGGNHEDAPALGVFRRAGFRVLDDTTVSVAGVRILGASDPVAAEPRVASDASRLAGAGVRLDALWRLARPRPQVVLVHDVRQAQDTIASAQAAGAGAAGGLRQRPRGGREQRRRRGAGGRRDRRRLGLRVDRRRVAPASPILEPPAGSRDVYTFQLIDFSRADPRKLVAVTTVSYAGGGRTVVTYTPFGD